MRAYPNELLLSVVARYHHLNGHKGIKPTRRKMYGLENKKTSSDLPTTILPINTIINGSMDDILHNNTLFPFYKPFLSEKQAQTIKSHMLGGPGGGVHFTSGIMASVVRVSGALRLCPICLLEDSLTYGEPFWHREHQLPGNLVCPIHECELLTHCLVCKELISANDTKSLSICPLFCSQGHNLSSQVVTNIDETLLRVSKGIVELFKFTLEDKLPLSLRDLYVSKLIQMKLCTIGGRINQQEVCSRFRSMFSPDVLLRLGVPVPLGSNNWLSTLLRKPRYSFHPLLHVLVIELLWGGVHGIVSPINNTPFGQGPWPCLNKISDHYKKHTILNVTISRCADTKKPVGSFKCELCGFHYSRRGPDLKYEDMFSYGRIKDFGHYWKSLADDLLQKGGTIRSIAKTLAVDSKTVMLYAKKKQAQPKQKVDEERDLRRNRLLQNMIFSNYTSFRKANGKDYSWLYRHDREWLQTNLPSMPNKVQSRSRVNWNQRDVEMADELNQVILRLRSEKGKPQRITLSKIGRLTGKLAIFERHLDKLPLCQGLLKINLETEEKHQMRKIDWALSKISQQGKRPMKWRVLRETGIRILKTENVEKYVVAKLDECFHVFQDKISA
ncbi:TnsD family Tn7-like transposition protein [Paenibacillus sp. DMB5]|uniref:TnsD family Tn7-like transposition protein n=1 Tax=Paenibacillus sp. DMB5 TaxID=1780103 RepID=UPI0009EB1CE6|nr:TnsD family Tn7-like transposition protein [Paenibacillus sp. DMB5]